MKLKFLFFSIILAMFSQAQSGIRFSGKITDQKTGEALVGASVYLPDLRRGTNTNANGEFVFTGLSSGQYLLEISYTGYSNIIENIELKSNQEKNFSMAAAIIENETVTVTGVSRATSVKRTPVPVTIIRKEDLFRNMSTNLVDNIAKTPGLSQVSTGPAVSKPFIRGLGYNRVLVVNDGIRQEGQQWGDEHGIEIDEQNVSKVEVLKGPASLMYGSDALAGVINIISFLPPSEGQTRGNIALGWMDNNHQRNIHADLGGNQHGFVWGVNGSYKAAGDYKNKYDGYVFNSKYNERDFGVFGGFNKNWGFTHFYFTRFDQRLGLVEGERDDATGKFLKQINNGGVVETVLATDADFKTTDPFLPMQRIQHNKFVTDNSFRLGHNRLTMALGYQRNQRQEFGNVLQPEEKNLWFDLGTFNYNLQYHLDEKKDWKTTVGVNGMQQASLNKGTEVLIPEYDLFDIGAFIYTQKKADRITYSGGIRFDNRHLQSKELVEGSTIRFQPFTRDFSNISGSAGMSFEVNKSLTLKFNLARGFRAPSIPELASNGAHEGTNRYEYGNQNLVSETSLQADGGIEAATEHVSVNVSVFYNSLRNFIYYRKLASVNGGDSMIVNGPDQFFAFRFDQQNAKLYGVEANLDIHPHPLDWLHLENSFSWVRGVMAASKDGSRNLPLIPAPRLISDIKVELAQKGKKLSNVFMKLEFENTFKQSKPFTGYNTETATPGYTIIHAGAGASFMHKKQTLFNLYVGVNNLTDKAYQNHLSRLKYTAENLVSGRTGVFNMGRAFNVKLNIPLSFKQH